MLRPLMLLRVALFASCLVVASSSFALAQDGPGVRFTQATLQPHNDPLAVSLARALRTRTDAFHACFEHRAADQARQGVLRLHLHFGVRSPTSTTMAIRGAGRLGIDEGLTSCIKREVVRAIATLPVQRSRYRARLFVHIDVPQNGAGRQSAERLRIEERARHAQVESAEAIAIASEARRRGSCLFRAAGEVRAAATEHAAAGGTVTSTRRLDAARAALLDCGNQASDEPEGERVSAAD